MARRASVIGYVGIVALVPRSCVGDRQGVDSTINRTAATCLRPTAEVRRSRRRTYRTEEPGVYRGTERTSWFGGISVQATKSQLATRRSAISTGPGEVYDPRRRSNGCPQTPLTTGAKAEPTTRDSPSPRDFGQQGLVRKQSMPPSTHRRGGRRRDA